MIINFHGLWNGRGKSDSEDRLLSSDNIVNFIKQQKAPIVFTGDFNLTPETESIKKFENIGLVNLIKTYDIKSTRTKYYVNTEPFADYTFVSPEIVVNKFSVLSDEVSDHAPLFLDFQ